MKEIKSGWIHPLSDIVLEMGKENKIIGVSSVSSTLAGSRFFGSKGSKAYSIVASDILSCMEESGLLVQLTPWVDKKNREKGGAFFEVSKNNFI